MIDDLLCYRRAGVARPHRKEESIVRTSPRFSRTEPRAPFAVLRTVPKIANTAERAVRIFLLRHRHQKKTQPPKKGLCFLGAGGGGRTRTVSPPKDFESSSSANSNTPAHLTYYNTNRDKNQALSARKFLLPIIHKLSRFTDCKIK